MGQASAAQSTENSSVTVEPWPVSVEACGRVHFCARELGKLGHKVNVMTPQFVSAYREDDKNNWHYAGVICQAVG